MDSEKIKKFWDSQADKYIHLPAEGIANLEEDPELLRFKVEQEKKKIMGRINLPPESRVLDLGTGTGQWAFRFAERGWQVVGVEYSEKMLDLANAEFRRRQYSNVELIHLAAQDYICDYPFDLIFISGLLIYLCDEDCRRLANNCALNTTSGARLILRDGTGISGRHEINNRYSENLNAYYSASYRTAEQYVSLFEQSGFNLLSDEDMFPAESPLNKWKETRLRIYEFEKV